MPPASKPAKAEEAAAPAKKSGKLKIIIIALLVLLLAGGGAAFFLMQPSTPAGPKPLAPPQYIALEPSFVVNLADPNAVHYLQADIQLQTRDPETAAAITLHMPIIRNKLLLMFGQQTSEQLNGRNGKEQLQKQALTEVRKVLKEQHAADKVDALLFTSVVIQ